MRGAANTLLSMSRDQLKDSVHTVSTGNFGHAIAYMANQMQIPCHVIVPDHVPETKMAGARRYGAEVMRVPWQQWWEYILGTQVPDCKGVFIHPEGHDEILAGTGTYYTSLPTLLGSPVLWP
jgi:threonine dehydratase